MTDVNDHVQLNPGVGGATIATDFVDNSHFQIVKIAYGAGSTSPNDVKRDRPLPVTIQQSTSALYSDKYVAVAGSTDGTSAVAITGDISVSVATVGISGGTITAIVDGVSSDIRSVASGVKIGVHTISPDVLAVTGNVDVDNQVDVNIANVDLPTTIHAGLHPVTNVASSIGTAVCKTGVRVKNSGLTACYLNDRYLLSPGENIFIEVDNVSKVTALSGGDSGNPLTGEIRWIAT
jgi:hypothetical protein